MSWRLASRLSVLILAILVVIVVAIVGTRVRGETSNPSPAPAPVGAVDPAGLQGTYLGSIAAPDFRLTDQNGHTISLSQFRGQPVILTFLYTHCPDQCPLTAEKLHSVMQSLGSSARNVAVLAVSTDPTRDTTSSARAFSKAHRMDDYWHYLLGTHSQLAPIWSSYAVYAAPTPTSSGGSVNHTTAIFIIDKQGHERVLLDNSNSSDQIAGDIRTLLGS